MKTPSEYPAELSNLLKKVASLGVTPTKGHVAIPEVEREITENLIHSLNEEKSYLMVGAGDLTNLSSYRQIEFFEDRVDKLMSVKNKNNTVDTSSSKINNLHRYDGIIIFADWIAGQSEIPPALFDLNENLVKPKQLHVVEFKRNDCQKLTQVLDGSTILNWLKYKEWLKKNSSHMHLGYDILEFENIRLINLSPDY